MAPTNDGYRSGSSGVLPDDGVAVVAGVRLPSGHQVRADPEYSHNRSLEGRQPVLWITDQPVRRVAALWAELQERFPDTGLWPLVLDNLSGAPERPWDAGELDPKAASDPGSFRAEGVLAEWWAEVIPDDEEEEDEADDALAPFGRTFPGLAPPSTGPLSDSVPREVVARLDGRLGLVAVQRPADAVAVLGWTGPVNHFDDTGRLAAVLRSWEDRFGAVVVGIGFDTLTVAVRRPPSDGTSATAVAAEHLAACSDNIWQGAGSIAAYAEMIENQAVWQFWWD